ncbi:MAG: hypothetical protein IKD71_06775 [Solobacterium sp.]|nr:hypothetical protein [Solobacterium sp.]
MLYINQLDYPDMVYHHNMKEGGAGEYNTVKAGGCGPCSLCMLIENMTFDHLGLEECLAISERVKANWDMGTDLKILGPVIADKYSLKYDITDDVELLKTWLARGGMAVANSGGDREGYTGLLTHGGHYVLVVSYADGEFCILDPSYTETKFHEEGREGKVREAYPFIYVKETDLVQDCANRSPAYYLFAR